MFLPATVSLLPGNMVLYYIKLVPAGLKNVPFGPNPEWLHTRNVINYSPVLESRAVPW